MCARYCFLGGPTLKDLFSLTDVPEIEPMLNIAPTMWVPGVAMEGGNPTLKLLQWGFLASWQVDFAGATRPINARSETVAEKPVFKAAYRSRRCIIPANSFYEWRGEGRTKECFQIGLADHPSFGMAGVYETWEGHEGCIESMAILTCGPNRQMEEIHDRMPVMLRREEFESWLDPKRRAVPELLRPYPGRLLIKPVAAPGNDKPSSQLKLF